MNPVYIVAEIGTNHNGNLELAVKTIQAARQAGADAVKFQIITADRSYTKNSDSYTLFKSIELSYENWKSIFNFARELAIDCFATLTNSEDLNDFAGLDCPIFKISSSNLTHFPLLEAVAKFGKPVIVSTGLSYLEEVEEAVSCLTRHGLQDITLLQCTSLYPTPLEHVNLNAIQTLARHFPQCRIGFSDHTVGIHCAAGAVALGAQVIEKHFTLDNSLKGPEHHFSANPDTFRKMVSAIREVERGLGSGKKEPLAEEMMFRNQWRRSLVALKAIKPGELLTEENIGIKRSPIQGLEPRYFRDVLGKKAKKILCEDDPLTEDLVKP